MDKSNALAAFAALSQETRLETVKALVRAGDKGLPAGQIASGLGIRQNLMSSHLNILASAGLVSSRRDGRSIIYTARFDTLRALLGFMMADCCQGSPKVMDGLGIDFSQTEGAVQ